ncbi:MAG: hypothetical protein HY801_01495 [Candidatus Lindowbacteria bacterium]|nr:hypothetical protein [Candidatus Lindowbacteria bacterium]
MPEPLSPKIHLAFRFHANFYHSYRGDTPDELGFGKDIRIIRNTIKVLDEFNAKGVPARGTWDIENYFSLEKIMPEHCPDIVEALRRRVAEGKDEVQAMSYNNGLLSAQTAAEFDHAIGRAITNAGGSGLLDLFGQFGPMVRPQEMMYTPIHLKMYPRHGINCISLYYSSVPFNAFSNFVKPLPFEQRFNPLKLAYPDIEETMTLLPAYNHGDIADNISLKYWLKRLRREQLSVPEPKDIILLIDADADDEYWYGYNWPVVSRFLAAARGIKGLIESVRDLDYIVFTTPSEYVKSHPAIGEIIIGQDTADGSFDGYSSWAEKWPNHQLWTGIERSRIMELQTRRLMEQTGGEGRAEVERLIAESYEARLRSLSTTHFGLASPVLNVTRLKAAASLVRNSVNKAALAFEKAAQHFVENAQNEETQDSAKFALFDYARGVSTNTITYRTKPSRALVRLPLSDSVPSTADMGLVGADGHRLPCAVKSATAGAGSLGSELLFVETLNGGERKDYSLNLGNGSAELIRGYDALIRGHDASSCPRISTDKPASVCTGRLGNEFIRLEFDKLMQPTGLAFRGIEFAEGIFTRSAINYDERIAEPARWTTVESAVTGDGLVAFERLKAEIPFEAAGEKRVEAEREFLVASGLPYLYVTTRVRYPQTRSNNYKKARARRLEQTYDGNWLEVMPCELRPALFGKKEKPLRIWKHNYCGHVSSYNLDYAEFSKNAEVDSFNNHVTHAWVAVSDQEKGLLVAQTANFNTSLAFCPMRTRASRKGLRIFLNPFGSYYGRQLDYVTASTGLGKRIALAMADQLDPYAPSYNGHEQSFSLLIAPYEGDKPPEEIRRDAEAFAYPYAIATKSEIIKTPEHRKWTYMPAAF